MKLQIFLVFMLLSGLIIPSFAHHQPEFAIDVINGFNLPGVGQTILIKIIGAHETVTFEIITSDGEVIEKLSFVASAQGEISLPWILSKDLEYGIYTITASDNVSDTVKTTFKYENEDPKLRPTITSLYTDKLEYFYGETVYVTGTVEQVIEGAMFGFIVDYALYSEPLDFTDDNTFNFEFVLDDPMFTSGEFYISVYYDTDLIEISFDVLPSSIDIQIDKSSYFLDDVIFVSGTISDLDPVDDSTIIYNIYDGGNIDSIGNIGNLLITGSGGVVNSDGTFNLSISINEESITNSPADFYYIVISIQDVLSNNIKFSYLNEFNISNEILHSMIISNINTIQSNDDEIIELVNEYENKIDDINNIITEQNNKLSSLSLEIDNLKQQLDNLLSSLLTIPLIR